MPKPASYPRTLTDWLKQLDSQLLPASSDSQQKLRRALADSAGLTALVVAGGVAANQTIRGGLEALAAEFGLPFVAPPLALCTDNAAMIAWAGQERLALPGFTPDALDIAARPRWPLDPDAAPVRGAGVKA